MSAPSPRCSLLVVDDDTTFRETVALILRAEGLEVRTANDGDEALRTLRNGSPPPDLIFTDLVMPHLSGWDLIDRLRSDRGLAAIPIVVLSGDGPASERARSLGLLDVLQKPFDLAAMLQVVARFCAAAGH